jgi:predicted transcriptional regulator
MSTAKERILRLVEELPDDASSEEIRYQIYVREKIAQGREDAREGRFVSEEELDRRLSRFDVSSLPE